MRGENAGTSKRTLFAELARESHTASESKSKATFASSETSKKSGRVLAVAKRKRATLESGTKPATSSKADVRNGETGCS